MACSIAPGAVVTAKVYTAAKILAMPARAR